MEKRIFALTFFLMLFLVLCAEVQDLPDVEISGPSMLRSFLEKRGLSGSELIIPDVVDSLNPLFPGFPQEDLTTELKMNKNALHLNYNSDLNLHGSFLGDNLFGTPLAFKAGVNRHSLEDYFTSLSSSTGIVYQKDETGISILLKYIKSESHYDIKNQYVGAINLNYYFTINNLLKYPFALHLKPEIQSRMVDFRDDSGDKEELNFNHNAGFSTQLSNSFNVCAEGYWVYKTPVLSTKLALRDNEQTEKFNFLRSISVDVTDERILPGIHLSKRFSLDSENTIHLYQKSALNIHENYGLLMKQPWQRQLEDPIVALKPLDAHFVFTNQNLTIFNYPVMFTLDCGVQYIFDEPLYTTPAQGGDLPQLKPETVFKNNFSFGGVYNSKLLKVSQSVELNKGWLKERSDQELPYLPFLTLKSDVELKLEAFQLKGQLSQYYSAKDELKEDLPEAIELGAELNLQLMKDFTLYLKGHNLLNKGKTFYKTLPTEPVAVYGGLILSF